MVEDTSSGLFKATPEGYTLASHIAWRSLGTHRCSPFPSSFLCDRQSKIWQDSMLRTFPSLLVSWGLSLCPEVQERLQNDSLERCWPRPVAHILIQYLLENWPEKDFNCSLFRMKDCDGYGKNPCIPKPSSHHYGSSYIMDCFIFTSR